MTLQDRALREQTLFSLYSNPPFSDTEAALKAALIQIVNKIYDTTGIWSKKKLAEIAKIISHEIGSSYESLIDKVIADLEIQVDTVSLYKLSKDVVDTIVSPTNLVQGYTMDDLFKTVSKNHTKQLQVTFAAAAARGASADEIVRLLKDKNDTLTKTQLKSAVITTQNEARYRVSVENYKTMEDEGLIDGYIYDATLDGRTTEYCRDHDGKVYYKPISEISNVCKVHFRCRSVLRPYSKDVTTRASMFGPVENEPYSKWFARQDEGFQKSVLGSKKFKEYQDGVYKIGGLVNVVDANQSLDISKIKQNL